MTIKGTVKHQEIEGGFWGIVSDDGSMYHPVEGLPHSFKQDGCRVAAEVEPANVMSFAMWGQNVRITSIKRI